MAKPITASYATIYILVAVAVGAATGAAFGLVFDGVIGGRRILAVLSALAAIVVDYIVRGFAADRLPGLFLDARAARTSPSLLFVACVIATAGGLATHDLALVFNVMYGPVLGGVSGLFASLMAAVLVVLREEERRSGSDVR